MPLRMPEIEILNSASISIFKPTALIVSGREPPMSRAYVWSIIALLLSMSALADGRGDSLDRP